MTKIIHDVFISHDYEDKTDCSNRLAIALKKNLQERIHKPACRIENLKDM